MPACPVRGLDLATCTDPLSPAAARRVWQWQYVQHTPRSRRGAAARLARPTQSSRPSNLHRDRRGCRLRTSPRPVTNFALVCAPKRPDTIRLAGIPRVNGVELSLARWHINMVGLICTSVTYLTIYQTRGCGIMYFAPCKESWHVSQAKADPVMYYHWHVSDNASTTSIATRVAGRKWPPKQSAKLD
eukprot:6197190-Pleurochrysis_carterae.AAC.2